jgi:hypothetical protein
MVTCSRPRRWDAKLTPRAQSAPQSALVLLDAVQEIGALGSDCVRPTERVPNAEQRTGDFDTLGVSGRVVPTHGPSIPTPTGETNQRRRPSHRVGGFARARLTPACLG